MAGRTTLDVSLRNSVKVAFTPLKIHTMHTFDKRFTIYDLRLTRPHCFNLVNPKEF